MTPTPRLPISARLVPAVSVIVPAYNVADYVAEALDSLLAQTMPAFEVIIIDDGSTDDTADRIAPYLVDPRFRLIRQSNGGLSAARNRGIADARAPYIAMLDSDDRYRPGYLEAMLARVQAQPLVDFVTCDAQSFTDNGPMGEIFSHRYAQAEPITLEAVLAKQVHVFGLCLVRTAVMRSVGGYDEALRAAEDLDLWLRLLGAGHVGGLVPTVLVDYRRRAGSLSAQGARLHHYHAQALEKALAALPDGEARQLAKAQLAQRRALAQFEHGVDEILAGRVQTGVAAMRASGFKQDSAKWRLAMRLFSILPPLAPPALAHYRRGNEVALTSASAP
jgi:GT2 family glycosyltransferase